jgi:hypothetical protein
MLLPASHLARLGGFRAELHACFPRRADALVELGDALLCAPAFPSLPHLSLEPVHQRGWGSAYAALASGRVEVERLRDLLVATLPDADPLVFAVDVTTWPRCDAERSPQRGYHDHPSRALRRAADRRRLGLAVDRAAGLRPRPLDRPGRRHPAAPLGRRRPDRRSAGPCAAWPAARWRGGAAVRLRRRLRRRPAQPRPGRRTGGGAGAAARRPLLLRRPTTPATGQDGSAAPPRPPSSTAPMRPPGPSRPPPWSARTTSTAA